MSQPSNTGAATRGSPPLVDVRGLSKRYRSRASGIAGAARAVQALDRVSFTLERGRTLAIVGESGAGKSTLARALVQLERPDAGAVLYHAASEDRVVDLVRARGAELRRIRRALQIVFQDPTSSLNPRLSIGAALGEVLRVHRFARNRAETEERVSSLLREVGLSADFARRHPHELSGGQRQRVAIARALAAEPELVVLDEPVSALDVSLQAQVLNLLLDLQRDRRLAYVYVTHDLSVVRAMADRVAVMQQGRFVEEGSVSDVFGEPRHTHTRALLAAAL